MDLPRAIPFTHLKIQDNLKVLLRDDDAMLPLSTIRDRLGAEAAFLIGLLRERFGREEESAALETDASGLDQEKLSRFIMMHEVAHLVRLQGPLGSLLSDDARRAVSDTLRSRAAWNLVLFREMGSLSRELLTRGIEVLFYKGVVLCEVLHGDLTTRPTRDMDVMVRSEDFLRLRRELLGMGFTEDCFFPERNAGYYMGVNREAAFSRMLPEGVELTVEVHWAPLLPFYDVPFDNRPFFRSSMLADIGGMELPLPCLEDQFLLLLAHHGVSDLWHSLKHITDLAFFLEARGGELDLGRVSGAIHRWGMTGHAGVGMALCRDLLGIAIPPEWSVSSDERLLGQMLDRLRLERPVARDQIIPANMLIQLRLADGLTGKARLIRGYLHKWVSPSLTELEHLRLPRGLFPLYYLLKPFRFLYTHKD